MCASEGVTKRFGAFTALDDVSLAVEQGKLVCFLGPSGCGKTTLLRVIAGLETQDAGRIEIGGRDVTRLPPSQRDFGIVFQSYALFPNLTVAQNVGYGLVNRRKPRKEIAARGRAADAGRPARADQQISRAAVGRPAAARGIGPRAGLLAVAAAAGRAAVGARCAGARAPARRDQGAAAAARHHHHHGDARPGRGARHGRPHRGDEPRHRSSRSDRRPISMRGLRRRSLPISSAP